jgi:hypothetical protein
VLLSGYRVDLLHDFTEPNEELIGGIGKGRSGVFEEQRHEQRVCVLLDILCHLPQSAQCNNVQGRSR